MVYSMKYLAYRRLRCDRTDVRVISQRHDVTTAALDPVPAIREREIYQSPACIYTADRHLHGPLAAHEQRMHARAEFLRQHQLQVIPESRVDNRVKYQHSQSTTIPATSDRSINRRHVYTKRERDRSINRRHVYTKQHRTRTSRPRLG